MHAPKDSIVEEFGSRVRRELGRKLAHIYWFGSRSRREGREDSDYDLFLETEGRLSEEERDRVAAITVDLSGRHNVVMDIHYGTRERLHGPNRFLTPFRDIVLREGVRV